MKKRLLCTLITLSSLPCLGMHQEGQQPYEALELWIVNRLIAANRLEEANGYAHALVDAYKELPVTVAEGDTTKIVQLQKYIEIACAVLADIVAPSTHNRTAVGTFIEMENERLFSLGNPGHDALANSISTLTHNNKNNPFKDKNPVVAFAMGNLMTSSAHRRDLYQQSITTARKDNNFTAFKKAHRKLLIHRFIPFVYEVRQLDTASAQSILTQENIAPIPSLVAPHITLAPIARAVLLAIDTTNIKFRKKLFEELAMPKDSAYQLAEVSEQSWAFSTNVEVLREVLKNRNNQG